MSGAVRTSGWSKEKVAGFKAAFFDFLSNVKIVSKDLAGLQTIKPNRAQRRALDAIFLGLENDVRTFVFLKARQLGMSTISYLLTIFYVSVFDGIQAAIVFDTESNRDKFRSLLQIAWGSLPESHQEDAPGDNRNGKVFANGSTLDYLVAGVRKTSSSGNLGRGKAYNYVHATEASSWGDLEGLRSLERSLSQQHPDRLYIFESTARGPNIFQDMWKAAKDDTITKMAVFLGWWSKEDYAYAAGTPLYEKYAAAPITEDEQKRIDAVKELYDFDVTLEQLAWFRHQSDPNQDHQDGDDSEDDGITRQELPWTEGEAFVFSGSQFFPISIISQAYIEAKNHPFKGYRYEFPVPGKGVGPEFIEFCQKGIKPVTRFKDATLKIWQDPDPNGFYVLGADPAYASSDQADRYCCQILRVYADGCDQVAEYCERSIQIHHFAWILAHLCGAYGNARFLLEINGPGEAVWIAFRELKLILTNGYMSQEANAAGLKNMFNNIRNYVWSRPDSTTGGSNSYHFITNTDRKFKLFCDFLSAFVSKELVVNSIECLAEMENMEQEGTTIAARGKGKDDRPMALALALRAWHDSERRRLISQNYTREKAARHTMTDEQIMQAWSSDILNRHRDQRQNERRVANMEASRGGRWRW